jgi:hypothetical protein
VSTPDVPLSERIHQGAIKHSDRCGCINTESSIWADRTSCRGALAKVVSDDLAHRIEDAAFPSDPTLESLKNYKMKVREIVLNLKSNLGLAQSECCESPSDDFLLLTHLQM